MLDKITKIEKNIKFFFHLFKMQQIIILAAAYLEWSANISEYYYVVKYLYVFLTRVLYFSIKNSAFFKKCLSTVQYQT